MNSIAKYLLALGLSFAMAAAANAEIVVIVSAKSSKTTMTPEEISGIFLGKSTALKPVNNAAPVRSQFYTKVAGKDDAQVKAIWSKLVFTGKATPPKELASNTEVVKAVSADPNAIGYVDRAAVDESVKVVYELK